MRALVLVLSTLVAALVLALAHPVSAQSADHAPRLEAGAALFLDGELDRELASIDAESQAATALYATGLVLHLGGIATFFGSAIAGFCISFNTSSCASEHDLARTGMLIGGIAAALGLVGIFVGVGLDVDSGNRRRDHAERRTLLFGLDGSSLSLRGTF